jgi:hypothetical protein
LTRINHQPGRGSTKLGLCLVDRFVWREYPAHEHGSERRPHASGVLQLEMRGQAGPYWYFHYCEGGKQKSLYIGKTDEPEADQYERPLPARSMTRGALRMDDFEYYRH